MKFLSFFLFSISFVLGQEVDFKVNDVIINSLPNNTSIVGLGDPTHQESTITKYRIDLIKKSIVRYTITIIYIYAVYWIIILFCYFISATSDNRILNRSLISSFRMGTSIRSYV